MLKNSAVLYKTLVIGVIILFCGISVQLSTAIVQKEIMEESYSEPIGEPKWLANMQVEFGEEINLKPLIREYVECFGNIHEEIRRILHDDIEIWDAEIRNVINSYRQKYGEEIPLAGLVIGIENEKGGLDEYHPIFMDFIERREELVKKNYQLSNLSARYVSSEVVKHNVQKT